MLDVIVYITPTNKKDAQPVLSFIKNNITKFNKLQYRFVFSRTPLSNNPKAAGFCNLGFLSKIYIGSDEILSFLVSQFNKTVKTQKKIMMDPEEQLEAFQNSILDSNEDEISPAELVKQELERKKMSLTREQEKKRGGQQPQKIRSRPTPVDSISQERQIKTPPTKIVTDDDDMNEDDIAHQREFFDTQKDEVYDPQDQDN